jgi:UDP-glucose 4-epimerase
VSPPVRVLITGGAGYIGSHLVDRCLSEGHEVSVVDDLSTGSMANLVQCRDRIEFVEGTILDASLVSSLARSVDLVFHLAAAVGVGNIVANPLWSIRVNTDGARNVIEACAEHAVKLCFASTSEVYGRGTKVPMSEDDDRLLGPTTTFRWSYSTAKAMDEHLIIELGRQGLPVSIVRYFNSYGPRLAANGYGSVVAAFIGQALAGEPLTVHGDGTQSRSFTYVTDTVAGTYATATNPAAEQNVFNIGNGAETTVAELAELILELTGSSAGVSYQPAEVRYGPGFDDTKRRVPDVSKAARVLDWKPEVSLRDGLTRTIEWWKATH